MFNTPEVETAMVGFRECGCTFSSSHLGLPYTLVTSKIDAI